MNQSHSSHSLICQFSTRIISCLFHQKLLEIHQKLRFLKKFIIKEINFSTNYSARVFFLVTRKSQFIFFFYFDLLLSRPISVFDLDSDFFTDGKSFCNVAFTRSKNKTPVNFIIVFMLFKS